MASKTRAQLADRVTSAAQAALAAQNYVAPIDVLTGIGWLAPSSARAWQQGRIGCLEEAIQASRILKAITILQNWAGANGLVASEVEYAARTPQREPLRFTHSGDPAIERAFRTHWLSPALSEKKQARAVEKASRPPELVVILPVKDWTCHRCGGTGDLLIMEKPGPSCLVCAGLSELVFLPSGNALLTRRAKAKSAKHAVVVRFSKTRGRYERQGLLVEPRALAEAQSQIGG